MYKIKGLYDILSSKLPRLLNKKDQVKYKMLYGDLDKCSAFSEEGYQYRSIIEFKRVRWYDKFSYYIPLIYLNMICCNYEEFSRYGNQDINTHSLFYNQIMSLGDFKISDLSDRSEALKDAYFKMQDYISSLADSAKVRGKLLYQDSALDIYQYGFNRIRDLIIGIIDGEIVFMFGLNINIQSDSYKDLHISKDGNDLVFSFLMKGGEKFICNVSCDRYRASSTGYWLKD